MAWLTEKGYRRVRVYRHPHRPPGSDVYEHVLIIETFPSHNRCHASEFKRDARGRFLPKRKRGKR